MTVETKSLKIQTKKENEIIDITEKVADVVKNSRIKNGIVTVFVSGSTGSLTTIEFEPGLLQDFPEMLSRVAPNDIEYAHEQMWHDGNGRSHVKASLVGPSLTIPFTNKSLTLGTWQQIVFLELDIRERTRNLVLQMIGE